MKLTTVEKLLIRSPLRAYMLRRFEAPRVLSGLDTGERSICLDIGCGSGIGVLLINQYLNCGRVVGIDVDPEMVTAAEEYVSHPPRWARNIRTDNIELRCEDATRSTFPDEYFDAVFLFGVLHHIREWKKVISEVYRTLQEGGVFSFVEEPLLPESLSRLGQPALCVGYELFGAVPISEKELKAALERSGFSIQHSQRFLSVCFVTATKGGA
jgi:SAM-dependent methyltransferase